MSVRKVTDEELMRSACEMTFLGKCRQTLLSMYKAEHSPARTQLFWVTFTNIPLFISTHLLRHHVGSIPYQLTCRDDRKGGNVGFPEKIDQIIRWINEGSEESYRNAVELLEHLRDNADRYTPVNLGLLINAQSIIDVSKLRLCTGCAHKETVEVYRAFKEAMKEVDPDLAAMMVRKCVYRGGICGESKCCGFNCTSAFQKEMKEYLNNFTPQQRGLYLEEPSND